MKNKNEKSASSLKMKLEMKNQTVQETMNGFFQLGKILRKLIECDLI